MVSMNCVFLHITTIYINIYVTVLESRLAACGLLTVNESECDEEMNMNKKTNMLSKENKKKEISLQ